MERGRSARPRTARSRAAAALLLCTAAGAACGGSDPVALPPDPGPVRTVKADPSFAADIQEIFGRRGCTASQCHGGIPARANLRLSADSSYMQLVGVPAFLEPEFTRVVAGSSTDSYLVIKLEGRQVEGDRMPRGGQPLDTIDLGNIRNWINRGARQN